MEYLYLQLQRSKLQLRLVQFIREHGELARLGGVCEARFSQVERVVRSSAGGYSWIRIQDACV